MNLHGVFQQSRTDAAVLEAGIDEKFGDFRSVDDDHPAHYAVVVDERTVQEFGIRTVFFRNRDDLQLPEGIVVVLKNGIEIEAVVEYENFGDAGNVGFSGGTDGIHGGLSLQRMYGCIFLLYLIFRRNSRGILFDFSEILLTYPLYPYIISIYSIDRGDDVHILIDNKSGVPIYEQIYSQIKNQIIGGSLKENEMLPSIRGLAKDLRISFITTKRAYEELEKDGFIYTLPGKGCYVAPKNVELLREENLKKIEGHMEEIVRLAASCNLSREEILEMINFSLEELR